MSLIVINKICSFYLKIVLNKIKYFYRRVMNCPFDNGQASNSCNYAFRFRPIISSQEAQSQKFLWRRMLHPSQVLKIRLAKL